MTTYTPEQPERQRTVELADAPEAAPADADDATDVKGPWAVLEFDAMANVTALQVTLYFGDAGETPGATEVFTVATSGRPVIGPIACGFHTRMAWRVTSMTGTLATVRGTLKFKRGEA